MDPHPPRGRTVSLAGIVTLAALVAYVFAPSAARPLTVAVMLVGALAVVTSAVVWARRRTGSRPRAVVAAASAAGLLGSVAYLHSLAGRAGGDPAGRRGRAAAVRGRAGDLGGAAVVGLVSTQVTEPSLTPYRLEVPQRDLDDLHDRLDRTRWPDELPGVGWAYGVPLGYLQDLAGYWRREYDWRAAERRLNDWPQWTTVVDGQTVHLAHVRSPEPDATPLLMTHGWPGSIVEFTDVVGPLTDPRTYGADPADAFHLVLPSIPGFGLSGPTTQPGWDHRRVAAALAEVMSRLGYQTYGVQGGDWGSSIARELARLHPDRLIGMHLNMVIGANQQSEPTEQELAELSPDDRRQTLASWERTQWWQREGMGYNLHAGQPAADAGLRAHRLPRRAARLDRREVLRVDRLADRPEDAVDRDLLLTNVMLYWLTGTAGSSARLYYERAHSDRPGAPPGAVGGADRASPTSPPRSTCRCGDAPRSGRTSCAGPAFEHGGHFAALEQPTALVEDVRAFFAQLRADG